MRKETLTSVTSLVSQQHHNAKRLAAVSPINELPPHHSGALGTAHASNSVEADYFRTK